MRLDHNCQHYYDFNSNSIFILKSRQLYLYRSSLSLVATTAVSEELHCLTEEYCLY